MAYPRSISRRRARSKKKPVQVLLIPVGGEPVVGDIPASAKGSYKAISEWAGGGICSNHISESPHLEIICNDDGPELGLPYNRAGLMHQHEDEFQDRLR
jgi:hypothetical protein